MSVPTNDPGTAVHVELCKKFTLISDPKTQPRLLDIVRRAVIFAKRAANDQRRNQKRAEGLSTVRRPTFRRVATDVSTLHADSPVAQQRKTRRVQQESLRRPRRGCVLRLLCGAAAEEVGRLCRQGGGPGQAHRRRPEGGVHAAHRDRQGMARGREGHRTGAQRGAGARAPERNRRPQCPSSSCSECFRACEGKATCCTRPPPRSRLTPSSQEAGQTPPAKAQRAAALRANDAAYAASVAAESSSDAGGATPGVSAQLLSATHADARPALAALRAK